MMSKFFFHSLKAIFLRLWTLNVQGALGDIDRNRDALYSREHSCDVARSTTANHVVSKVAIQKVGWWNPPLIVTIHWAIAPNAPKSIGIESESSSVFTIELASWHDHLCANGTKRWDINSLWHWPRLCVGTGLSFRVAQRDRHWKIVIYLTNLRKSRRNRDGISNGEGVGESPRIRILDGMSIWEYCAVWKRTVIIEPLFVNKRRSRSLHYIRVHKWTFGEIISSALIRIVAPSPDPTLLLLTRTRISRFTGFWTSGPSSQDSRPTIGVTPSLKCLHGIKGAWGEWEKKN